MEGKREQDWAEGEGGRTRSLGGLSWPHGECWCLELSPSGVKAGQASPQVTRWLKAAPGGAVMWLRAGSSSGTQPQRADSEGCLPAAAQHFTPRGGPGQPM